MGLFDIPLSALAVVARAPRNHFVAMTYQTANRYSEPWEEETLKLPGLIEHYRTFMLPTLFRVVDSSTNYGCGEISGAIETAINSSPSPYFAAGIVLTGAQKDENGTYSFQHFAAAIVLKAFPNAPLIIWDPIQLVAMGQDNTKPGAYYRWPVRSWASVKSVHYSGISGLAAYYLPGTYTQSQKDKAKPKKFMWL